MVEDRDSERLTDVVDAVGDELGMRVGPGTEVGGYIIDGELGHGGMGVVYSATHPVIRKRAAIKILRPEVSQVPIAVERFIQEARAVNQIGHPNIIDIFAYGALPDGRAYHVMDLLVGESLRSRLKRSVLHPSEAASVIDEIASALMAAHDNGFVHRDLKPDNVFLAERDNRWPEVKLLDFGLAKLMPEFGVPAFTTKTGVMLGTPEYMSPEQARGHGVDYRTDIYALGIVMFEILAGSRPFPPLGEPVAVLMQHAEEPPMSLADVVAGLPDEMMQLVGAMLAKTPQARPSLAAVRTVIKRLRNTQLPTRSLAGAAVSSFNRLAPNNLAISPSRVGAEAVLPGDPMTASVRRPAPAAPTAPAVARGASAAPPLSAPQTPARTTPAQPAPPQPGPAPGARDLSALPAALRDLVAAAPSPASKPDTTTRGLGVNSLLASQAGVRFKAPTPPPEVPRNPPVGSQPLPSGMAAPASAHSGPPLANPRPVSQPPPLANPQLANPSQLVNPRPVSQPPPLTNPQLANPQLANPQLANPRPLSQPPPLANPQLANPQLANPQLANPQLANPSQLVNPRPVSQPPPLTNPQLANPQLANPQLANPPLASPQLANPQLANPQLANPRPLSQPPQLTNPQLANPQLANPQLANPQFANPRPLSQPPPLANPQLANPSQLVNPRPPSYPPPVGNLPQHANPSQLANSSQLANQSRQVNPSQLGDASHARPRSPSYPPVAPSANSSQLVSPSQSASPSQFGSTLSHAGASPPRRTDPPFAGAAVDPLRTSARTTLGVGPGSTSSRHRTAVQASPEARRWWLVIATLLVVVAAFALGFVLLGS